MRSSAREVAKALGYSREQEDRLSKRLGTWHYDTSRGDPKRLAEELARARLYVVPLSLLLLDLLIWGQHRLFHAFAPLWRLHRMHHADLEFDDQLR